MQGMMELTHLLDPLTIKGFTLKNRIVMPPMQNRFATPNGMVTDELVSHYVRRSEDLGLLIIEHCYISLEGKLVDKQLGIYEDQLISGLTQLASQIQPLGVPTVVQINHAGRMANSETIGMQPVAPSQTESARALLLEEIETITDNFVLAAERAIKAGFDGVEVHGSHGFLLNQFFSPLSNQRQDKYGGSLENRMRLPLEVIERVRKQIDGKLLYQFLLPNQL